MSYEPRIILVKKDLEKSISSLEVKQYSHDEDISEVAKYLLEVNSYSTLEFGELELIICQPELSSFNNLVIGMLCELKVYFQLYN